MYRKRFSAVLLAFMLLLSCSLVPAAAVEAPGNDMILPRVSGRLDHSLPANKITPITQAEYFDTGDVFSFNCTYTPKSASVDFGYIDNDKVFHYVNRTNGSINESFEVVTPGQYALAIRNNEDYEVKITGTVRY